MSRSFAFRFYDVLSHFNLQFRRRTIDAIVNYPPYLIHYAGLSPLFKVPELHENFNGAFHMHQPGSVRSDTDKSQQRFASTK